MLVTIPDTKKLFKKVADQEAITVDEVVSLIKAVDHLEQVSAYLASCCAATAESLDSSTSISQLRRHASICETAVGLLKGAPLPYTQMVDHEVARCARSSRVLRERLAEHEKAKAAKAASRKKG